MIIDSHCHLNLLTAGEALDAVLDRAQAQDVSRFLNVSVDLESFPTVLAAAEQDPRVFASVGVHPNTELTEEVTRERLCELAAHPRIVAIGETGLDYYRSEGDLDWQRDRFRTHIAAARAIGKPLIIHTRDSGADCVRILREEQASDIGGVMHCFVDDWATAQAAMELNFYISFSGIVTFKNATQVQDVAKRVPLDRLLVETDAPYLAPVPRRGKPNEPAYVRHVVEFIAGLRGMPIAELSAATTQNFFKLFPLAA
jgi:TatD DNase family protein